MVPSGGTITDMILKRLNPKRMIIWDTQYQF